MDGISNGSNSLTTCAACGAENTPTALFCCACTAPLAVTALHELDEPDLRICRAALLEVLANAARIDPTDRPSCPHDEALWQAYLSAFWLRPETALILYAEAMAV